MTTEEFVTNFKATLDKVYDMVEMNSDWLIISSDPDCDCDYGVDELGRLIIAGSKTNLPVNRLKQIRYRAGKVWDGQEFYISLVFDNDLTVYLYIDDCSMPGDQFMSLTISKRRLDNFVQIKSVSKGIVHCLDYNWEDPFVIENGTLIAYLGDETEVFIGEGINKIAYRAFESSNAKKVYLSDTVETIEEYAFEKSKIEDINLKSVKTIEDFAFYDCHELTHIVLPKMLDKIGKHAFYHSGIKDLQQIENNSCVELDSLQFNDK